MSRRVGWPDTRFWCLAAGMEALCLLLTWSYPLTRYYSIPLMDLGKLTHLAYGPLIVYVAVLVALYVLYVMGYRWARDASFQAGLPFLMVTGTCMAFTMVWLYPVTANDLFDTFFNARILAYYNANPLVVSASEFPNDPFLMYKAWLYVHAGNGPLWWELTMPVSVAAGAHLLVGLVGLKLLVVLFYIASIPLVWLAVERMRQDRVFAATLLYAWSPVLLYEGAGNGHIDLMMMFFVLAAWCAVVLERPWLVLPLLMLSILTKFVTLLLVPPFLWYAVLRWKDRQHLLAVIAGGVGSIVLGALIYAPLWPGKATSVVESRQQYLTTSLATLLNYFYLNHHLTKQLASLVGAHGGTTEAGTFARYTVYGVFALCYAWYTWRAGRGRDDLLRSWCMILFSYLAIGVLWFQPWYLAWLVVPVALRPDDVPLIRRTLVFCVASLAPYYTFYMWVAKHQPVPWEVIMTWTTALIFVPVLTVVLYDVALWWLRWDEPMRPPAKLVDAVA